MVLIILPACLFPRWGDWDRWDGEIDVDNDRNDFYFEAEDLSSSDRTYEYKWRCDTGVAEVTFDSYVDFEGEVVVRIDDDHDDSVFDEWYEGVGEIHHSSVSAPGDPGDWRVKIRLRSVDGSFRIRILAQ
jgi:hypothetical protein